MKPDAILVDTSVFDRNGRQLERGLLKQLEQFKGSAALLVLPDIVLEELKLHLLDDTRAATDAMEKAIRDSRRNQTAPSALLDKLDDAAKERSPEMIVEERIRRFLERTGAVVIRAAEYLDLKTLVDRYFAATPPFSATGKKKHEFPDAIILLSAEEWAKREGKKVIAVSGDGDWTAFCEKSETLEHVPDLSKALERFHPLLVLEQMLSSMSTQIALDSSPIRAAVATALTAFVEELHPEPDADSVFILDAEYVETSLDSFSFEHEETGTVPLRLLDQGEDWVVVEVRVSVTYDAEAHFGLSVRDSVDNDYVSMGSARKAVQDTFETRAILQLSGVHTASAADLEVEEVEILDRPRYLNFGTVHPDWSQDDFEESN